MVADAIESSHKEDSWVGDATSLEPLLQVPGLVFVGKLLLIIICKKTTNWFTKNTHTIFFKKKQEININHLKGLQHGNEQIEVQLPPQQNIPITRICYENLILKKPLPKAFFIGGHNLQIIS